MTPKSVTRPFGAEPEARVAQHRSRAVAVRERSCVGCRSKAQPAELTRWVLSRHSGQRGGSSVEPDLALRAPGRGAWLHPSATCFQKAAGGFSRSFKTQLRVTAQELGVLLGSEAERRVALLLVRGVRAGQLVVGTTLVESALASGRCQLVLVASDAPVLADSPEIETAVRQGLAASWGNQLVLGGLTGRSAAGVLGVLDRGLAGALKATIAVAQSASLALGLPRAAKQAERSVVDLEARVDKQCSTEVG